MHLIYEWLFPVLWCSFAAYWFISAIWVKNIKQTEPVVPRWIHLGLSSLAFVMTFSGKFRFGLLGWQLLAQSNLTFFTGAAIALAGLSFAVWARLILGRNWSASVAVKEGHRLIRMGPYRLVGVILLTATYLWKSRREEQLMVAEFGDEYVRYRHEVNALVPFAPRINRAV